MANMMAGIQTEGTAESGFGIRIAGFHCGTFEFGGRLESLKSKIRGPDKIVQWEDNGYTMFLALKDDNAVKNLTQLSKIATFRREPHRFFSDLPKWLMSTKAQHIEQVLLSGSLGSISLTILYRPAYADGV